MIELELSTYICIYIYTFLCGCLLCSRTSLHVLMIFSLPMSVAYYLLFAALQCLYSCCFCLFVFYLLKRFYVSLICHVSILSVCGLSLLFLVGSPNTCQSLPVNLLDWFRDF